MTDRDKARVKKHKEETDQPMVISKFDKKKGKRTVYLVSNLCTQSWIDTIMIPWLMKVRNGVYEIDFNALR